ncbi:hypothetical protein Tdes44962_MAKER09018 [Teratosphaeria destructans]|uniref:Uncharacterized protein n=1 Tax=Teratosphaeria destructans TaxID=418781 RepID=A0A9W7SU94_9PEZI|nr:hypothetical protein Tdes44962_MAKER09018 [Teratosphaeria destructans]
MASLASGQKIDQKRELMLLVTMLGYRSVTTLPETHDLTAFELSSASAIHRLSADGHAVLSLGVRVSSFCSNCLDWNLGVAL